MTTIKKLTKLHDNCEKCAMPIINCICELVEKTDTQVQFWILSSGREFIRPSNTARLIQLINPGSTDVFLWERTVEPEVLIRNIQDSEFDVYLLFPAETHALEKRKVIYKPTTEETRKVAFVLIDGTWKEARRILNKSDYLSQLPIVSLEFENRSEFDLRKGAEPGQGCTLEAAMAVLRLNGEHPQAAIFERGFQLFTKAYKASTCGHRMKP